MATAADITAMGRAVVLASGGKRQQAFADAFTHQNDKVVRDAVMANMTGLLALSPKVRDRPHSATNDEMRLADMRRAD
ncbi:hypothetical protein STENM223S_07082 [Streptomyces tendae]